MDARAGLCSTTPDPVCAEEVVSPTPTWEKRPLPSRGSRKEHCLSPATGKAEALSSLRGVTGSDWQRDDQELGWLTPILLLEIHSVSCLPGQENINSAGGFPLHPFGVSGFWNLYWGKFQGLPIWQGGKKASVARASLAQG